MADSPLGQDDPDPQMEILCTTILETPSVGNYRQLVLDIFRKPKQQQRVATRTVMSNKACMETLFHTLASNPDFDLRQWSLGVLVNSVIYCGMPKPLILCETLRHMRWIHGEKAFPPNSPEKLVITGWYLMFLDSLANDELCRHEMKKDGLVELMAEWVRKKSAGVYTCYAVCTLVKLVGQDENHPVFQDPSVSHELFAVVKSMLVSAVSRTPLAKFPTFSIQAELYSCAIGVHLLSLADTNKQPSIDAGLLDVIVSGLLSENSEREISRPFLLESLQQLAFVEKAKVALRNNGTLMDTLRDWATKGDKISACLVDRLDPSVEAVKPASVGAVKPVDAQETKQQQIMISYNWGCQKTVLALAKQLQLAGFNVWLDVEQMEGSTLGAMADAVEGSRIVLVCVSRKYKESVNCRLEGEYAFQKKKEIIPLMMEANYSADGWLGALMGTKLWFDCSSLDSLSTNLDQILRAIRKKLGGSAPPPPALAVSTATSESTSTSSAASAWTNEQAIVWLQSSLGSLVSQLPGAMELDGECLTMLAHYSRRDSRLYKDLVTSMFSREQFSLAVFLKFSYHLERQFK
jgi:phosphopantothenate-cysteine ligase